MEEIIELEGTVNCIKFYNQENYYAIMEIKPLTDAINNGRMFSAKGTIVSPRDKMHLSVSGKWTVDKKFGETFVFSSYKEILPSERQGIINYLTSGFIKGIGPQKAQLLYDKFGKKTLRIIEKEPERLLEIEGIGQKVLNDIVKSFEENKIIKELILFLKKYNVTDNFVLKVYKAFGKNAIPSIKANPYCLTQINGFGFKTADYMAMKMGIKPDDYERIKAGVLYTLQCCAAESDSFLPSNVLIKKASAYDCLNINAFLVKDALPEIVNENLLITDKDNYYLPKIYRLENETGQYIAERAKNDMFDNISYGEISTDQTIEYSEEQLQAIHLGVTSKMLIITGGPGTGKTTILNGLLKTFQKNLLNVVLAAPTGRAAKRMAEVTGHDASTIHRLLNIGDKNDDFIRMKDNFIIKGDVIILDECSMINLDLMHALLGSISPRMKVIMIGDVDQLPPIGCGAPFKDIINSNVVPVVRLTKIFRQSQESKIICNAKSVNNGLMPDISNEKGTDFYMFRINDAEKIKNEVIELVTQKIPSKFGYTMDDIQILSPKRKKGDINGATDLNIALQAELQKNYHGKTLSVKDYNYMVGDRVMQMTNDYGLGVFNGDIGKIVNIDPDHKLIDVSYYDGSDINVVRYDATNNDELSLAYASTVHKSQGCEYPVVVVIMSLSHRIMLQRQLLYTAITRAKKLCIIIGNDGAVQKAVTTENMSKRFSNLKERIISYSKK